jgi:hypothetical protein
MSLIILTALCLLACGFMLYVLVQWMRDTGCKPVTKNSISPERDRRRLHVVSFRNTLGHGESFQSGPDKPLTDYGTAAKSN